ncbi:MAG: hypothetical protein IH614_20190 [Desulfuromonadales bacterium]|nr:hypothetical protein [Desulfuromonadales bacterium]
MTWLLAALLVVGIWAPADAILTEDCSICHGTFAEVHGSVNHTAAPASGTVAIFADTDHDDASWNGPRPYFGVRVDCSLCHSSDLLAVHADNCSTCHPQPYRSLETWNGGCQQGGCHSAYHEDVTVAHLPWENSYDYQGNDCNLCHGNYMEVPQSKCMNCHATYGPSDVSRPVTTTNALSSYKGPAKVVFSITDNGKVGVGTTFYRLDGQAQTAGSHVLATEVGPHNLEFWSVDQAGNVESPAKTVSFSVVADTLPPTTTSNAQSTYYQVPVITLTATDDSTLGVKATYYQLNGGPVQTGTRVQVPATNGVVTYTLRFWSVDWSGNIETAKSVQFTVTSGSGTIRLVWANSDTGGSPCPDDPEANATWIIRSGGPSGSVVASGSGSCPNWSGVNDVLVPASTTPYYVVVDWWDSYYGYDDQTVFANVYVTTPGVLVRLSY